MNHAQGCHFVECTFYCGGTDSGASDEFSGDGGNPCPLYGLINKRCGVTKGPEYRPDAIDLAFAPAKFFCEICVLVRKLDHISICRLSPGICDLSKHPLRCGSQHGK